MRWRNRDLGVSLPLYRIFVAQRRSYFDRKICGFCGPFFLWRDLTKPRRFPWSATNRKGAPAAAREPPNCTNAGGAGLGLAGTGPIRGHCMTLVFYELGTGILPMCGAFPCRLTGPQNHNPAFISALY